jgi:hypothetical protein
VQRRDLIRSAAAGVGWTILKSGTLRGQNAPSNKLNVALMGAWGRGTAHYDVLSTENVVAICDVNENRLKEVLQVFPNAKAEWDWRRIMDMKEVDAVVICTADHHHAFIANWALNRGKHVHCEKPLGISVDEVRTVRANYLKQKVNVATQHGTQRHAFPNFERVRELVMDGAIGELKTIHGWDARQLPRPGYPQAEGMAPSFFHYEQWIGPSPYHPYSPQYFGLPNAGNNCLSWNMYRDFGVGQMGDMGAHTMDLLWNAIDAGAPTAITPDMGVSDPFNPDITPVKLKVSFEHPKNSWRGPVTVVWYQGGLKPDAPRTYIDLARVGNGAIFEGTKGVIVCDFNSRVLLPNNEDGDLTYYRRRSKEDLLPIVGGVREVPVTAAGSGGRGGGPPAGGGRGPAAGGPGGQGGRGGSEFGPDGFPVVTLLPGNVPPSMGSPNTAVQNFVAARASGTPRPVSQEGSFQREWIDACKGKHNGSVNGTSSKTHCDFDYAGTMMEQMLLGLVAHRAGKRIEYDPASGRVTNMSEANDWLKRTYRAGWTLNG